MQAVGVFVGAYPLQHGIGVQTGRKRHLHDHGVHAGILVERVDHAQKARGRNGRGQAGDTARHADALGRALFLPDVDRGGGVVPHQHDSERRRPAATTDGLRDALLDPAKELIGNRLSVKPERLDQQNPSPV